MKSITWDDCLKKTDEWIEAIKRNMLYYPEHGVLYQQKLAKALVLRQELEILAKEEEKTKAPNNWML
jgi:hypothetical protein